MDNDGNVGKHDNHDKHPPANITNIIIVIKPPGRGTVGATSNLRCLVGPRPAPLPAFPASVVSSPTQLARTHRAGSGDFGTPGKLWYHRPKTSFHGAGTGTASIRPGASAEKGLRLKKGESKRRQKTLKKRTQRKRARSQVGTTGSTSAPAHIRRACDYPLEGCWAQEDWQDGGLAVVVVARRQPEPAEEETREEVDLQHPSWLASKENERERVSQAPAMNKDLLLESFIGYSIHTGSR